MFQVWGWGGVGWKQLKAQSFMCLVVDAGCSLVTQLGLKSEYLDVAFHIFSWLSRSIMAGFQQVRYPKREHQVKTLLPFLTLLFSFQTITSPRKVHIVNTIIFPVVIYIYESWVIKKAEKQRTDAFELWCWGRLLRVPWTANRSNQSFLKEINPEYSLEGLMLTLKLPYFGHPM